MADKNFDEAKAKSWVREVEAELDQVDMILAKVAEECKENPAETDTILKTYYKLGEGLNTAWKELEGQFKETISGLTSVIEATAKAIKKAVDKIAEYASKAKY